MKTLQIVLLMVGMATAARAATQNTYTWDASAGDGNWFNSANWTGPSGDGLPGDTQNPAGNVIDQAAIGNVSGTINYTPGTPTVFDMLLISKNDATPLTVNVNGDMTVQHTPNWIDTSTEIGRYGCNLAFNVNAGTVAVKYVNVTSFASPFYVAPGASFIGFADSPSANRNVKLSGASTVVKGWLGTLGPTTEHSPRNNRVINDGGEIRVDGGTLFPDAIFFCSRYGTLTLTNNAVLRTRFGADGITHMGNYGGSGYSHLIRLNGGVATNVSTLRLAGANPTGAANGGLVNMQVTAGTWYQGGATHIGDGRVGVLTVSGGTFESPSDVYVGGGRTSGDAAPTTSAYSGTLTVSGGTVAISNPDAGVVRTATDAGLQNPGSITHFFTLAAGLWDFTYLGQRLSLVSLGGTGNGLETGVAYFAHDTNPIGLNAKNTFGVATTSGGLGLTGTARYSGCTYFTLPARLIVGNPTVFSGSTTLDIPGTLNLDGGTLTADEFVANMGTGKSMVNFTGGTLLIRNGSDVDLGSPLTVGNGTLPAVLGLGTGTHAFADGLVIAANATLSAGGIGAQAAPAVTGDVTLRANAKLHCDVVADDGETLAVTGALTLPATAAVQLASDGTAPKTITLLTASSIVGTDLSDWTVDAIGEWKYLASVSGNAVVLERIPLGSVIIIK